MTEPTVEALGVYRLPVSDELFEEQFTILYGYDIPEEDRIAAVRQCRDQLSSVVLVEALVTNRDSRFSVSDFTQPREGLLKDDWQAAWAEAYLAPDGESLLVERWGSLPDESSFRVAFFLHYWDSGQPLHTSYGAVNCPKVQEMPERLQRLVPYEPVD